MARVPRRFTIDDTDVKAENQDVLQKLAGPINTFVEEVVDGFEGRLDVDNFNQGVVQLNVRVDVDGFPISSNILRSPLIDGKRPNGIICLRAQNTNNPNIFPTTQPFISFSLSEDLIRIRHVSGLQAGEPYRLTILVI
jgi:hypothetical protein